MADPHIHILTLGINVRPYLPNHWVWCHLKLRSIFSVFHKGILLTFRYLFAPGSGILLLVRASMSTANYIAACLINLSYEKQSPVSNLKLQKLLYYAQAWHLAIFKRPLFNDEIEAWVHGPVVPDVFRTYRDNKWAPIPNVENAAISADLRNHLEEVWGVYGSLEAYDLERITHSEDPWLMARGGIAPDVSSHAVIKKDWMREYYSARLNG